VTAPARWIAAAVLASAAAWLLAGSASPANRLAGGRRRASRRLQMLTGHRTRMVGGAASSVVIALLTGPVPGIALGLLVLVLARRAAAARGRRQARAVRIQDLAALRALASELVSGLPPPIALRMAGGSAEAAVGLRRRMLDAAAADSSGGDPAAVLLAGAPAGTAEAALAAAWSVCQRSGSSLAAPVHRLAESAAAQLRIEREAEAALASARSSAQLLAVLPLAGVVLGQVSGSGSLQVLLTTGVGQACLVAGGALDLAGLAWLDRLADAAGA
jgi:tight adherence protein B